MADLFSWFLYVLVVVSTVAFWYVVESRFGSF
jgi:hypothetical protein